MELSRLYNGDAGVLQEKLQKIEKPADESPSLADLKSNSRKKETETLENRNALLLGNIANLRDRLAQSI